jgi:hypothetical protein
MTRAPRERQPVTADLGGIYLALRRAQAENANCDRDTMVVIDLPDGTTCAIGSIVYEEDLAGALVIKAGRVLSGPPDTGTEPPFGRGKPPLTFTVHNPGGQPVELVPGRDYEVRYRIDGMHRRDRIARMGFMDRASNGELLFTARGPDRSTSDQYAGTQHFRPAWILAAREVETDHAKRYVERRAPDEVTGG